MFDVSGHALLLQLYASGSKGQPKVFQLYHVCLSAGAIPQMWLEKASPKDDSCVRSCCTLFCCCSCTPVGQQASPRGCSTPQGGTWWVQPSPPSMSLTPSQRMCTGAQQTVAGSRATAMSPTVHLHPSCMQYILTNCLHATFTYHFSACNRYLPSFCMQLVPSHLNFCFPVILFLPRRYAVKLLCVALLRKSFNCILLCYAHMAWSC